MAIETSKIAPASHPVIHHPIFATLGFAKEVSDGSTSAEQASHGHDKVDGTSKD
jgi:hypothetical protein